MTTRRPTADAPVPPDPTVSAGPEWAALLPDEATLNQLAGQFFSAVAGGRPASGAPQPAAPLAHVAVPPNPVGTAPFGASGVAAADLPAAGSGVVPPGGPTPEPTVPDWEPGAVAGAMPAGPGYGGAVHTDPLAPVLPSLDVPRTPARFTAPGAAPGGPTPTPAVPEWDPRPAAGPVRAGGVHTDPLVPVLPSLDVPFAPSRFTAPAVSPAGPAFYFLERPEAPAGPADSPFYFLGDQPGGRVADPHPPFDVNAVRSDFPILRERVNGHQLVWFDNAATTQKPNAVIDRIAEFYRHENSNIHRAAHELAARSTDAYEHARATVARFLGAGSAEEIIFVRGATEGINLIAQTWGRKHLGTGDEIIISHLEHHANIVPWQLLAAETGAVLRVIPVDDTGQLRLDEYTRLLSDRTKLVSVTQVSNALGTITPVREVVALARRAGAVTLIDGAQSVPHTGIDVRALDADFFVFSGHKLFGPTGIGVVYGKSEVLQDLPPWQGGGNMISDVTLERSLFQPAPGRFEAGTGNIADAVGLGAAIDYVQRIGMDNIARYEHGLLAYATPRLAAIPGVRLVGTAADKASVLSFVLAGYEPLQVGKALNEKGIAVRAGHHCAQPILRHFGLEATVRPSFAFYNTCAEIDRLIAAVDQLARARR
ncbi:SufS family cysteine desulfurase [Nocardia yamanashiensis]|uniref:family 2A encapsulin nanocompartment cargo protein cysteine desulfurase n=1 Tax=Nocardia yamanashiensis TaxID=209247 RepID=UPI001E40C3D4|nr:family 2A encapsulin nanocompartment cargo protein cysteine desulfurase [Nocardia yamanashiensis]UGT41755.1 SufS family cysteine desulfurase [Nocardia yamanashiensis]